VKDFAVARNVPLVEPGGTVSEAGTVRLVELELRAMVPPAVPVRTRVQVLEALGAIAFGLQESELIAVAPVATLIVPPVAPTVIESPAGDAPRLLLIVSGTSVPPERVTDTLAITPSEMAVESKPQATQV
jgi:hypothetical protein